MSDTMKFLTHEERQLYRYLVARRLWELLVGWGLTALAIVPGSWLGVAAAETYGDAGMTLAFVVITLLMWVGMTRIQKAEKTYRLYRTLTAAGESREAHRLLGRGPGPRPMPIPKEVGQRIERHYRRIGLTVLIGVAAAAGVALWIARVQQEGHDRAVAEAKATYAAERRDHAAWDRAHPKWTPVPPDSPRAIKWTGPNGRHAFAHTATYNRIDQWCWAHLNNNIDQFSYRCQGYLYGWHAYLR